MSSTFFGLTVGLKALQAQQKALDVTGHNIANANTPGFTRQDAVLAATTPIPVPSLNRPYGAGQLGTGVMVEEVRRLRDGYVDLQMRSENKTLGYWEAKSDTLEKIQLILNEPSDSGLASVMDQFWESWQDLSKNPESLAARAVVQQRGVAVAETFSHVTKRLDELEQDLDSAVQVRMSEVNSLGDQIRALNQQVQRIEISGDRPNDLKDKRDALLDQLAKLVDTQVSEDQYGRVTVVTGGHVLVQGVEAYKLQATQKTDATGGRPLLELSWEDGNSYTPASGTLRGLLESRGSLVSSGKNQEFGIGAFDWQSGSSDSNVATAKQVTLDTAVGDYGVMVNTAATRTILAGSNGANRTGVADANFAINGVTISVAATDTLQDIVNKINAMQSQTGVKASFDNNGGGDPAVFENGDHITLTQVNYGPPAKYDVTVSGSAGVLADLGLDATTKTSGTDVAVTVTGPGTPTVSQVDGRQVTLSNGLVLEVAGAAASSATVTVSKQEGLLAEMRRDINTLAVNLAAELNKIHEQGLTLEDINNNNMVPQGIKFFVDSEEYAKDPNNLVDPKDASCMMLNPAITYNVNKIAAARPETDANVPSSAYDGDGRNALLLAGLKDIKLTGLPESSTLGDYYRSIVSQLGVNGQEATRMVDNQNLLVQQLDNQRQSVSGVSLDEEMTNMVKFQQAYNAAARIITTVDEMLDVIVNRMGTVGR